MEPGDRPSLPPLPPALAPLAQAQSPRPALPPAPLDYATAAPSRFGALRGWVTVAVCDSSGDWHAARVALSRQNIASRAEEVLGPIEAMALQVPATEVEWARDIISRHMPHALLPAAEPHPPALVAAGGAPAVRVEPGSPRAVAPAQAPLPLQTTGRWGGGYDVLLAFLWLVLLFVLLAITLPLLT